MRRLASLPAFLLVPLLVGPAAAGPDAASRNFIIAASEGYGVQDCLGGEGGCGQVVADAWCEAHGEGPALAFGKTDDVTGAIASRPAQNIPAGAYFITCGR